MINKDRQPVDYAESGQKVIITVWYIELGSFSPSF